MRRKLAQSPPSFHPPQDRASHVRYFSALRDYPAFVRRLTAITRQRSDFLDCQYLCGQLALESSDEVLFLLRLLEAGALPGYLPPSSLGAAPYPIVDPKSGLEVGHYKFPCLALPQEFYFFQVTFFRTRQYRVDVLRWKSGWSAIEIDGTGHDPQHDLIRERSLGLETRRLTAMQIISPGFHL